MTKTTERWDIFEFILNGPTEGNPFMDVAFSAKFAYKHRVIDVDGFYDGANTNRSSDKDRSSGAYKVRIVPDTEGEWTYTTRSNVAVLDSKTGAFTCVPASAGNHGPVHVHNTYHFAYLGSLLPDRPGKRSVPAPALRSQLPRVLRSQQALGDTLQHPAF